jgi:hypothetical protein
MEQQITPYHHLPGSVVFPSGLLILVMLFILEPVTYIYSFIMLSFFLSKIQIGYINKAESTLQPLFSLGILLVDREHYTNLAIKI